MGELHIRCRNHGRGGRAGKRGVRCLDHALDCAVEGEGRDGCNVAVLRTGEGEGGGEDGGEREEAH